jgi:hypothetical protein
MIYKILGLLFLYALIFAGNYANVRRKYVISIGEALSDSILTVALLVMGAYLIYFMFS